jgi:PhzF family phenazine biosynthesis protein
LEAEGWETEESFTAMHFHQKLTKETLPESCCITPGHEINLCGHATVGSMYCLKSLGIIAQEKNEIWMETNVGILPISFRISNGELFVTMKQDRPRFIPFQGSIARLAECLGLHEEEIDPSMPIVYGSTGTWTLLVPIKQLSSFSKMKPYNPLFLPLFRHD